MQRDISFLGGSATRKRRTADLLTCAVLAIIVGITFSGVLNCDFIYVWDDVPALTGNPNFRGLGWTQIRWMFTTTEYPSFYIPLSWLSWALTYVLFEMDPFGFHLGNLVFHLLNVILLYFLIARLLDLGFSESPKLTPSARCICAGVGTLFWALHPLRVEPVTICAARPYSVSTFFSLLCLLSYLRFADPPAQARTRGAYLVASALAYVAALLSYPTVVSLFFALAILDIYPLRRFDFTRWREGPTRRIIVEKIPFILGGAFVVGITIAGRHGSHAMNPTRPSENFGMASRFMQAAYVEAYYVWRTFYPINLSPVYSRLIRFEPFDAVFVVSLTGVIGISLTLFRYRRRLPAGLALWMAHLLLLLPVLGVTLHPHYTNDRYSYLPGMVWGVGVSAGMAVIWSNPAWRKAAWVCSFLLALLLAGCALLSMIQVRRWTSGFTLFPYVIEKLGDDPYRYEIEWRLGELLAERGEVSKGLQHLDTALQINPQSARVWRVRGLIRLKDDSKGAWEDLRKALALRPDFPEAHRDVGMILEKEGKLDEAIAHYEQAVQNDQSLVQAQLNLASALMKKGRNDEALNHLQDALKWRPGDLRIRRMIREITDP